VKVQGRESSAESLCARCRWVREIRSAKGSTFSLCTRSKDDPAFPKYPPQPVVACSGFAQ